MEELNAEIDKGVTRRLESSMMTDRYSSVEFSISSYTPVYQFKLLQRSFSDLCILVNKNSDVLSHLKAGDILNLKYNRTELPDLSENLKTEIRHIEKIDTGRYSGNYLVGLLILQ